MLYFVTRLLRGVAAFSVIVAFGAGSQGDRAGLELAAFEDDLELLISCFVSRLSLGVKRHILCWTCLWVLSSVQRTAAARLRVCQGHLSQVLTSVSDSSQFPIQVAAEHMAVCVAFPHLMSPLPSLSTSNSGIP